MIRRHGKTPIGWAADTGLLGPTTPSSATPSSSTSFLGTLVDQERSQADCRQRLHRRALPAVFARYGQILENFGDYLRAGINMGLGTDTTPHNMLEEMRKAAIARVAARDINTVSTADMLHAATVGGSNALLRQDLGYLRRHEGDIVVTNLECSDMFRCATRSGRSSTPPSRPCATSISMAGRLLQPSKFSLSIRLMRPADLRKLRSACWPLCGNVTTSAHRQRTSFR